MNLTIKVLTIGVLNLNTKYKQSSVSKNKTDSSWISRMLSSFLQNLRVSLAILKLNYRVYFQRKQLKDTQRKQASVSKMKSKYSTQGVDSKSPVASKRKDGNQKDLQTKGKQSSTKQRSKKAQSLKQS